MARIKLTQIHFNFPRDNRSKSMLECISCIYSNIVYNNNYYYYYIVYTFAALLLDHNLGLGLVVVLARVDVNQSKAYSSAERSKCWKFFAFSSRCGGLSHQWRLTQGHYSRLPLLKVLVYSVSCTSTMLLCLPRSLHEVMWQSRAQKSREPLQSKWYYTIDTVSV